MAWTVCDNNISRINCIRPQSAEPVPGETYTVDNTYVAGVVLVTISGDVDGDRDVDIFDIVTMASAFGSTEGDLLYNQNYDLDGDGDIDILDLLIAAGNYQEEWRLQLRIRPTVVPVHAHD